MAFALSKVFSAKENRDSKRESRLLLINQDLKLNALVDVETRKDFDFHVVKFAFTTPCFRKYIEAKELRKEIEGALKELGLDIDSDDVTTEIYITHGTPRENRKNLTMETLREDKDYFKSIGFGRMGVCLSNRDRDLDSPDYSGYSTYYQ